MVTKEFLESKEYAVKREAMQREINRACYKTQERSSEIWKKTPEEKLLLANMKLNHREKVRNAGFDPNKRINTSEPFIGKVW